VHLKRCSRQRTRATRTRARTGASACPWAAPSAASARPSSLAAVVTRPCTQSSPGLPQVTAPHSLAHGKAIAITFEKKQKLEKIRKNFFLFLNFWGFKMFDLHTKISIEKKKLLLLK
jgi:hypothetical protein